MTSRLRNWFFEGWTTCDLCKFRMSEENPQSHCKHARICCKCHDRGSVFCQVCYDSGVSGGYGVQPPKPTYPDLSDAPMPHEFEPDGWNGYICVCGNHWDDDLHERGQKQLV